MMLDVGLPLARAPIVMAAGLMVAASTTACNNDMPGEHRPHDDVHAGQERQDATQSWSATIAPTSFALLDESPLAALEGPPLAPCGPGGLLAESDILEIRTAWCDPADVVAPLPFDVTPGTGVDITLSHSALIADGGQAHFALFVGDEQVWDHETTLPAPAAFLSPRVHVRAFHAVGTPVMLHVHNHGSNTYKLLGVRLSSP